MAVLVCSGCGELLRGDSHHSRIRYVTEAGYQAIVATCPCGDATVVSAALISDVVNAVIDGISHALAHHQRHDRSQVRVSRRKPCRFPECDKLSTAQRLCPGHYAQLRKGQELKPLRVWGKAS